MRSFKIVPALVLQAMLFSIFSTLASASDLDPNARLAEWNGGFITVSEYKQWWHRMDPKERPNLKTLEDKKTFLDNMIKARFLLAAAESARIDTTEIIRERLRRQSVNILKRQLEKEAIESRIKIDPAKVDEILSRRTRQIVARHIVVPTYELAQAILDSLHAGAPFERLAIRYSVDAAAPQGGYLGEVKWGDFTEAWCEKAFALKPGEVSDPLAVESGYVIIKVEDEKIVGIQNPEFERRHIEYGLYKEKYIEESRAFRDSLYLAYNVSFNDAALVKLALRYAEKLIELGIRSAVVDWDVIPDLTPSEQEMPVVTFDGGSFTCQEVVDMILAFPYPVRPTLDDADAIAEFVSRQLSDTLFIIEAKKRGLDELPSVKDEIERVRQRRITMAMYRQITEAADVPEDSLRAYYEEHREEFRVPSGWVASKIVLRTPEAADSALARIKAGEPFEDVAIEVSTDPFTAPKGGDMGFMPYGKDTEFDGFVENMNVGDIDIFRSVEGWVVLWLREKREPRILEFEEAKPQIINTLLPMARDRLLDRWFEDRLKGINLKVDTDLLSKVDVDSL